MAYVRNIFQIEKLLFAIKTHIYLHVRAFVHFNVGTVVKKYHYCPNVIGIISIGYDYHPLVLHSQYARELVKWAFSRTMSHSISVELCRDCDGATDVS